MEHTEIIPECKQMFIRLEEKIDGLIQRADKVNGRYEKHMDESTLYRKKVDEIWAGIHFSKYVIMVMFGSGIFWIIVNKVFE